MMAHPQNLHRLLKTGVLPFLAFLTLFMTQCRNDKTFIDPQLVQKWQSAELAVPESVLFDSVGNRFLVSNINGDPFEKDGNGFISLLSPEGKTIQKQWVAGLDAPKGMGIAGNRLYVTNIDEFVETDLATGEITNRYKADSAKFLNDIAIDANGVVYGSDTKRSCIYKLANNQVTVWKSGNDLTKCNGLCYLNGFIYIGTGSSILKADTSGNSIEVITDKSGPVDGLKPYGHNEFLFSDYNGAVYCLNQKGHIKKLLDTSKAGINAADIEYVPSMNLLLVPTFSDHHIAAYELK